MTNVAHHRLHLPLPEVMQVWHFIVWVFAVLLAIVWFAGWILPAF
jgi:hypothetical protein